jgi:predicted amidophosphoribosyltransferase
MRNGHTYRVCPNCGAEETAERTICSQCGLLTVLRVTRAIESEKQERGSSS